MERTAPDHDPPRTDPTASIEAVASRVSGARRVVALTGAGISAESGIATFRDADGLWAAHDPDDVATLRGFRRDPERVWRFYAARRAGALAADPNPAHAALAALERRGVDVTIVTQNIDGLHARAGSQQIVEVHGSLNRAICAECSRQAAPGSWEDAAAGPPHCPHCGGLVRPDVVWFGESLPMLALGRAYEALRRCDVCLSIGTSAQVEPAASFAYIALEAGAVLVEVNPEPTSLSRHCHFRIRERAGVAVPALVAAAWSWPGAESGPPPDDTGGGQAAVGHGRGRGAGEP